MWGLGLIRGETVIVKTRVAGPADPFGAPTYTTEEEPVDGVLVAPGSTADLDATRPEGVRVRFTLGFPRDWDGDLRGATVTVRGIDYAVVGSPAPYTAENTPGPWTMPVEVTDVEG